MKQLSQVRSAEPQAKAQQDDRFSENSREHDALQVERAILKTVLYSDLFDYALTPEEISHYLVEIRGSHAEVEAILLSPARLGEWITRKDGFVILRGREELVDRRSSRSRSSDRLWRKARFFVRILGNLPFVRMVAVTGALAMDNSNDRDDVDMLIVTAASRVWLARALAVMVVYAGNLTPNTLCPNYVISEEALSLEPRTIYVAHEFVQMVPLYGYAVHEKIRSANPWISRILPNAGRPLHAEPEYRPGRMVSALKRLLEWLLSGVFGDRLEAWEMRRKIRKFAPRTAGSGSGVILDKNQVKGHFDDHGARICSQYQRRLEEYQLETPERA